MDAAQALWVETQGGRLFVREAEEFKDRSELLQGVAQISVLFEDARWHRPRPGDLRVRRPRVQIDWPEAQRPRSMSLRGLNRRN